MGGYFPPPPSLAGLRLTGQLSNCKDMTVHTSTFLYILLHRTLRSMAFTTSPQPERVREVREDSATVAELVEEWPAHDTLPWFSVDLALTQNYFENASLLRFFQRSLPALLTSHRPGATNSPALLTSHRPGAKNSPEQGAAWMIRALPRLPRRQWRTLLIPLSRQARTFYPR